MDGLEASASRKRSRTAGLAIVAGTVLVLTSCGGPQRSAAPPGATVAIRSFAFAPPRLTVESGTEVTWTNEDEILHTVTTGAPGKQGVPGVSEGMSPRPDELFDGELQGRGAAVTFTFRDAGSYRYFCAIHSGMTGTVVVR